jgi:hypothetical protein
MNNGIRASSLSDFSTGLLLDSYSSNLAGVYSVRKLLAGYAGSCLRVRRSSDSTEQDIGWSSNALDLSALASFVGSSTGYVVRWYDQSAFARHLDTVDSDATAPTIRASSTTEVNTKGLPRAKFLSSSMQRIYRTSTFNISSFVAAGGANTCLLVCNVTSDGTNTQTPISHGNSSVNPRFLMHVPYTTDILYDHGNNGNLRVSVTNPADIYTLDTNIFGFRARSAATSEETIRQQGTSLVSTTFSGSYTDSAKRFSLGANYGGTYNSPFNGHIQEVIIWNADIGASALAAIEADATAYYIT